MALIIVCDDMQDTDEGSMLLFKHIMKHFHNIAFVGMVRDTHKEISAFAPANLNVNIYQEGYLILII